MTMVWVGRYALLVGLLSSSWAVFGGWAANRMRKLRWQESVRGGVMALTLCTTTAVFALEYLLMTGDYAVRAVYNHSDQALPMLYKLGALWGGDSGSVLFWGWILSLYAGWLAWRSWSRDRVLTPVVIPLVGSVSIFFLLLSNFVVNPFWPVGGHPANGVGLDPLLQNLVMTIHPPAMYTGLIGLTVPAAYTMAALWTRTPWAEWIGPVRRWTLFSWGCLSTALILGGMWAYMDLGWGGYWAWDPVENAALLPWLTATAFLHAVQLEQKRGVFRGWTASLSVGTFLLTLVATYITRSGVLKNSVHSFTGTGVGPYFVVLFWVSVAAFGWVLWSRRDMLKDRRALDSGLSKESLYLLINMTFAVIAGIVLVGTFFPVISKALVKQSVVLNVSFFNLSTAPLFVLAALVMGSAPAVRWHGTRVGVALRYLRAPIAAGAVTGCIFWLAGSRTAMDGAGAGAAGFALVSMLQEYRRGALSERRGRHRPAVVALVAAVGRNRRKFGGYLVHMAYAVVMLGVIASHTQSVSVVRTVHPGQTIAVAGYRLHYQGLNLVLHSGHQITEARLAVENGSQRWEATPGMSFFPGSRQPVAQISIHEGPLKDLYVVLEGTSGNGTILLDAMVNPLVTWIWAGMFVVAAGTLVALSAPVSRRKAGLSRDAHSGLTWQARNRHATEGRDPL